MLLDINKRSPLARFNTYKNNTLLDMTCSDFYNQKERKKVFYNVIGTNSKPKITPQYVLLSVAKDLTGVND